MLMHHHKKFYVRLILLFLIASTLILYYVANKHESQIVMPQSSIKDSNEETIISRQRNVTVVNKIKIHPFPKRLVKYDGKVYRFGNGTEEIKIAAVLCGERLNQTLVTLKSAQIFSKQNLHFILVADENNQENLKIGFYSGLRSLLYHIDSLMYIDTDVLFMQPVEDLWHYFYKMNDSHIAALSPEHEDFATGWYNRFARHPYYEPLGVNSGVMLMNLTKMRKFQWEKYLSPIMKEYKLNIVWGDQDIINIIFHFHTEKLYVLPCEWNYRPDHCMYSSVCKTAEQNGVAAIHGNRGVFHNNKQPAFKAIYKAMSQFDFDEDIQFKIIEQVKSSLKKTVNTNCGKHLSAIFSKMEYWKKYS